MIENYRTGLLWRLFMGDTDVQRGLGGAGLHEPSLQTGFPQVVVTLKPAHGKYVEDAYDIRRHPDTGLYAIPYYVEKAGLITFNITSPDGVVVRTVGQEASVGSNMLTFPQFIRQTEDVYKLQMEANGKKYTLPIRMY